MTQILGRFSGAGASVYFPGAAFLLAAMLALCALVVVLRVRPAPEASRLPEAGAAG
jgi:hypothetical protein